MLKSGIRYQLPRRNNSLNPMSDWFNPTTALQQRTTSFQRPVGIRLTTIVYSSFLKPLVVRILQQHLCCKKCNLL